MKISTFIEVLIKHKAGELYVRNVLEENSVFPGQCEIAICDKAEKGENTEDVVKRIVQETTGMTYVSFDILHVDRCMGRPMIKKVIVCTVDGEKENVPNNVEWVPKTKWKELLESGAVSRYEKQCFHDFFYQNGAVPEYFIDENRETELSMEQMKSEAKDIRYLFGDDTKCVFAWYDLKTDEILVYIWDEDLPEKYLHRIISKNTCWTEEEELEFVSYSNKKIDCEGIDSNIIYKAFKNKNPDWSLAYEGDWRGWELLTNIYYYLKGGAKGILTNNGLGEIAQVLDRFSIPYNKAGSTPSEILFDLPLPVLQALNSERGAKLFADEQMIRALKLFYQEEPRFFNKRLNSSKVYDLSMILEVKYIIDELLAEAYKDRVEKYAYEDEHYAVIVPKNLDESLKYAIEMFHEYWKYLGFVISGQTSILLMVDKKNQNNKVAIIEIVGEDIIEASGKYGIELDEEIELWLENYVEIKQLKYKVYGKEEPLPLPFD